jgi:phospholipid/cholesterol/gamma-HCH transport system substrate-binding protein
MKINIENRARIAFVGLLLLVGAATLAWYLVESSRQTTFQIHTRDSVSGLITDSPVEFHGVQIGKVTRVALDDPRSVSILLSVDRKAPITTATVATITARGLATRGFTGYVYVALEDVGTKTQPLTAAAGHRYPVIPTAPSRSMSLDATLDQVNDNVQQLTGLLQSVLDQKTIASLKQSVDSLGQVTRMLAANNERLASLIVNVERAGNQVGPLLDSSNQTVTALQTQVLPEAQRALVRLGNLSVSLSEVVARIKQDPSVVIRGGSAPAPGPGETRR